MDTQMSFERKDLEIADSSSKSFVGFLQIFCDKTETTLESTGSVLYPVHTLFMNFSCGFRR